jgi:hypothetical protein
MRRIWSRGPDGSWEAHDVISATIRHVQVRRPGSARGPINSTSRSWSAAGSSGARRRITVTRGGRRFRTPNSATTRSPRCRWPELAPRPARRASPGRAPACGAASPSGDRRGRSPSRISRPCARRRRLGARRLVRCGWCSTRLLHAGVSASTPGTSRAASAWRSRRCAWRSAPTSTKRSGSRGAGTQPGRKGGRGSGSALAVGEWTS